MNDKRRCDKISCEGHDSEKHCKDSFGCNDQFVYKHPLSNCCSAPMPDYPDSDLCPKCKEHCEIENGGE